MKAIVCRGYLNKRTKQISITIPKKVLKSTNPKLEFDKNSLFTVKIYRGAKI